MTRRPEAWRPPDPDCFLVRSSDAVAADVLEPGAARPVRLRATDANPLVSLFTRLTNDVPLIHPAADDPPHEIVIGAGRLTVHPAYAAFQTSTAGERGLGWHEVGRQTFWTRITVGRGWNGSAGSGRAGRNLYTPTGP